MGHGLGPLQRQILEVLARETALEGQARGATHGHLRTVDVVELLAIGYAPRRRRISYTETRVRNVRRALDSLWQRGLVDKLEVRSHHEPGPPFSGWRIRDEDRPPEPAEAIVDAYGRVIGPR